MAHRRLFADDSPRFFTGVVEHYEQGIARVRGHSWLRDPVRGDVAKKGDQRVKLVALGSGTLLVYLLDEDVDMDRLRFDRGSGQEIVVHDGSGFEMDLTERRVGS